MKAKGCLGVLTLAAFILVPLVSSAGLIVDDEWAVDANTVMLFHLNEGSGASAANAVSGGNAGAIVADTTWTSSGRFDDGLNAVDGDAGYFEADLPANPFPTGAFTLDMWIKPTTLKVEGSHVMGLRHGLNLGDAFFRMYPTGNIDFGVMATDGVAAAAWKATGSFATGVNFFDGNWHHVAGTFDGNGTLKVFVNGEEKKTTTYTGFYLAYTPTLMNATALAWRPTETTSQYAGDFDEFRLSNIARTDYSVIPEPSAVALLGLGALALTWWRRRRC